MTVPGEVSPGTRRGIATAFLALFTSLLTMATFEFMMVPLQVELGMSVDQVTGLSRIPSAAGLIAVFVAGILGDRLGYRPLLLAGISAFLLGAVLVIWAPNWGMLVLGRSLDGVGGVVLSITGLAILNSSAQDEKARGRLFGYFAALAPATFLVGSVVASWLSDNVSWRVVPVLWAAFAVVVAVLALRMPTSRRMPLAGKELWAPLLAGLCLAGIGLAASTYAGNRPLASIAVACSVLAAIALVMVVRKQPANGLDLRIFHSPGVLLLILAIWLAIGVNFFFFTNLFFQYHFALPLVQISLLLACAQLAAVFGGFIGGRISSWWGAERAAIAMLVATAVAILSFFVVTPSSAPWVPLAALCLVALPTAATVGPLTQALLDRAPEGASGFASSLRNAMWSVGSILGGVVSGAIAFAVFTHSLAHSLTAAGVPAESAEQTAEQVRMGAFTADLAVELGLTNPLASQELISTTGGLGEAQVAALRVMAISGFITVLLSAILVHAARRRALKAARVES